MLFNQHTKAISIEQQQINDMSQEIHEMYKQGLQHTPKCKALMHKRDSMEYAQHRARIVPISIQAKATTSQIATNTNKGVSMKAPTFSNDLEARKQQYMEYLVHTGDHTIEEVAAMDMRTLRTHIDSYIPRTITVRTALPNGGTTTHYITKKAA